MLTDYWIRFRDAFARQIEASSDAELDAAWRSQTSRTRFYCDRVLPQVAEEMALQKRTELFKVDVALCMQHDGRDVPLIFVESENLASTADHEVWKLCSLAAPLKVLISCAEWCDEPGYWPHGGHKRERLDEWVRIIRAHNAVWPQPCVYGLIVGERNGRRLRFYASAIAAAGHDVDAESVLFDRELTLHGEVVPC